MKVVFTHVCLSGGGWFPSIPCRSPGGSPGPSPGGKMRGLARKTPGPHPAGVCNPPCTEADTPPPRRRLLLQAVRIPMECILVSHCLHIPSASESKALASSLDIPKICCTFNGSTYPWSSAASYSFDASIYSRITETMYTES